EFMCALGQSQRWCNGFRSGHCLPGAMTTWALLKIARAIEDAGPAIDAHLRPVGKCRFIDIEDDRRFCSGADSLDQPDASCGCDFRNVAIVTSRVDIFFNLPLSVINVQYAWAAG